MTRLLPRAYTTLAVAARLEHMLRLARGGQRWVACALELAQRGRRGVADLSGSYDASAVESKWQKRWRQWDEAAASAPGNSNGSPGGEQRRPYVLAMFPYPSGSLHMGHVRVYTMSDTLARFEMMRGARNGVRGSVLHPMGWDAFGLPAENAAFERGVDPAVWTANNIAQMKRQLCALGPSFDWHQTELSTADPSYYRWTQSLFLRMWARGLAYRDEALVNWDPIDCTVLANEQVDAAGKSWRSGAVVEQRPLRQWFFAITRYADRLVDALDGLAWPEEVKTMQRQWVGRRRGALVRFGDIEVYTSRPETIYGVTFVAVSPQHARAGGARSGARLGVVRHPLTGAELPVLVGDYVLGDVGTGAVMGVPRLDERDAAFAAQHALPLGPESPPAVDAASVLADLAARGVGRAHTEYRMRNWLVSRQRLWGTPIPAIYCFNPACANGEPVPVPEAELPVVFPPGVTYARGIELSRDPVLSRWAHDVCCPRCGSRLARREVETMDTFVDSSWYYARFTDARNSRAMFSPEAAAQAMPVGVYVGGIEHAVLHLLYARFVCKFLFDEGLLPTDEPFTRLLAQGMVQAPTFSDPATGGFLPASAVSYDAAAGTARVLANQAPARVTFEKMSKSKHNGVDPLPTIAKYGADTTRLFILFKAPPELPLVWDDAAIAGQARWVQRIWALVRRTHAAPALPLTGALAALAAETRASVERVLAHTLAFNVALAQLMRLSNALAEPGIAPGVTRTGLILLVRLLAPMAPHLASEAFAALTGEADVFAAGWPAEASAGASEAAARAKRGRRVLVQVDGRVRGTWTLDEAQAAALPDVQSQPQQALVWLQQQPQYKKAVSRPLARAQLVLGTGGALVLALSSREAD